MSFSMLISSVCSTLLENNVVDISQRSDSATSIYVSPFNIIFPCDSALLFENGSTAPTQSLLDSPGMY